MILSTARTEFGTLDGIMKDDRSINIIDESIRIELNAAELYRIFAEGFPEDAPLWQKLHREERNHAALLRTAKDSLLKRGTFPFDLVADCPETLKAGNAAIEALVKQYAEALPSRREAFEAAIRIEESPGECHFLEFMQKQPGSSLETVFQLLNREDKDHARRIREHFDRIEFLEEASA